MADLLRVRSERTKEHGGAHCFGSGYKVYDLVNKPPRVRVMDAKVRYRWGMPVT